ncbi:aspartate--tRNA ligase [Mesoplasma syrphidae]|uniref:Aspartate--tRNA ligase n=1 Tax=Mesoplasma syrphidae TaxID=225999 RepID=A0A2K9BK17_9MOLU|nr:aspartate--tRNA ligase [Mesoplasma syrphidae]AUF83606.1 aspartate--tRNA ligase [Mesoplasma syrphidae]
MKRTHNCGQLNIANVGQAVLLQGWVKKIRKMGAMNFIDMRDFYGITQLIIDEAHSELIQSIRPEYVIEVTGTVVERKSKNLELPTGEIEIKVTGISIINQSELTPFQIEEDLEALEDTRMTYRYLDLRRTSMQQHLKVRAKLNSIFRSVLEYNNFLEVETPYFGKSTPEGARDFLVPSRLNRNKFYALPQSPQLYKQLLMISGIDRYYQIARCFRDEDLRIDRQPEFTQLDLEMSFATGEDVMVIVEELVKKTLKEFKGIDIKEPLLRMPYREAIKNYGIDKPDLRYDLKIHDLEEIFSNTTVKMLVGTAMPIRGIMIDQLLGKRQIEELTETAKQNGLNGFGFAKVENGIWSGSIASQLSEQEKVKILEEFEVISNGTLLLQTGPYNVISQAMGALRIHLARIFNMADLNDCKPLWVTDFPLFEWNEDEQRFEAAHHPFTMPKDCSLADFDTNKANAVAYAYDLVINGYEIGSGSQRITDPEIQQRMFDAVELTSETVERNFGWFMNAYKYGAPYHAGMGLGIDRWAMIMSNAESIRDVIAFPKNSSGIDPMNNAPDYVAEKQLSELFIKTT